MVVFDASTLILIAKADLLDLFLTSINVPVAIPSEVEKECCGFKKALDAIIIQKALDESRIKVFALRNRRLVAKLQTDFNMGKGEAEAIALALDGKAQIVAIDDKNGIDACKVLGIAFTTAVGILIRSRENGFTGKARRDCQTCAASKVRSLQTSKAVRMPARHASRGFECESCRSQIFSRKTSGFVRFVRRFGLLPWVPAGLYSNPRDLGRRE